MKNEIQFLLRRIGWNTYRFANKLDRELTANGVAKADLKEDRRKYIYKIDSIIRVLDVDQNAIRVFVSNVKSYEEAFGYLKLSKKANSLKLDGYFDFKQIISLLLKSKSPDFFYKLAKFYKNFELEENGQGSFSKLIGYIDIPDEDLELIVDALIFTKNAGCPLSQKNIVKYYDSNRTASQDINSLKEAWIFAYEHKIPVTIRDFIQTIKYERDPYRFVVNYNKILNSDLPIPFEKFKIFNVAQNKIEEFIGLMIKSKIAEIYLDFETLYDDMKLGRDVWSVMRYLIKFHDSGFDSVDYASLRNFQLFGGQLDKLHEAFLYNRKRKIIDEKAFFDRVVEILLVKSKELNFNSLSCIKAIELAYAQADIEAEELGTNEVNREEVANDVFNDYLAGVDVYVVINYIKFAKAHGIFIAYGVAKIFNQLPNFSFKEAVFQALNPQILKDYETFLDENDEEFEEPKKLRVTTKDNIEILINLEIQAVLIPNNYFAGSDEKILFQRANAILIDEIQRKYNHDEIIVNIDKISKNVLFRLMEETRDIDYKYIPETQMNKVKSKSHHTEHGHDSHIEEQHSKKQELNKESKHHEANHHQEEKPHHEEEEFKKSDDKKIKFISVSKYKPLKVIIPRIEFVESTFKEYEKAKAEYDHHIQAMHTDLDKLKAEIELKKAWARGENIKYKFLEDDNNTLSRGHH